MPNTDHPTNCRCHGSNTIVVDDPSDAEFYIELPCPGQAVKQLPKEKPKVRVSLPPSIDVREDIYSLNVDWSSEAMKDVLMQTMEVTPTEAAVIIVRTMDLQKQVSDVIFRRATGLAGRDRFLESVAQKLNAILWLRAYLGGTRPEEMFIERLTYCVLHAIAVASDESPASFKA